MSLRPIPDRDGLFRHVVFPNAFRSTRKRARAKFDYQKLIRFYDESDGIHASLAWERYLPTTNHVHGYGSRLAAKGNQDLKDKGKFTEEKRNIYCGAYRLTAHVIRNLMFSSELREIRSAEVTHKVEDEIAHVDLRFILDPDWGGDVEGTKTAIMDRLWSKSAGPLTHICENDRDINPHPSALLHFPPGGEYDKRPWWVRSLCVVRFFLLCFWHHLSGIASKGNTL